MDYQKTLSYLYAQLPMFTKVGLSAYKKDLQNILKLSEALGNPHHKIKTIHVGGTNGKGSVSHMMASILQTAGYKTGLYTSPHLKDFRERIRINGQMIDQNSVIEFVADNKSQFEEISPSFFEVTVAMAFNYFAKENVDIAVIEVGLGGRLDSTNIISPDLAIITNIGLDHVEILGDTPKQIAYEKAGIIKYKTPIVIGEYTSETQSVFISKAEEQEAPITFASDEYQISSINLGIDYHDVIATKMEESKKFELSLDLTGLYQTKNLATVLSSVDILNHQGYKISEIDISNALKKVKKLTNLGGRWHVHQKKPLIISDTGHNEDGIKEVIKNINEQKFEHLHIVLGMVKDKDSLKILQLLPQNATYYFSSPQLPRAKPAIELQTEALKMGLKGESYQSVNLALEAAKSAANENDFIFVGGSTFVVAEII